MTGPFRLVKLGYFLLREYFPRHDELCSKEGELLLKLARSGKGSDASEARELATLLGTVPALLKQLWD